MNKDVAQRCLLAEAASLKQRTYDELAKFIGDPCSKFVVGDDGKEYQLQVHAFWDQSKRGGNLRVVISVDDGGLRRLVMPLTETLIVARDGEFLR